MTSSPGDSNAAGLEAIHGDRDGGMELCATTIDSYHRAGDAPDLALMFANLEPDSNLNVIRKPAPPILTFPVPK